MANRFPSPQRVQKGLTGRLLGPFLMLFFLSVMTFSAAAQTVTISSPSPNATVAGSVSVQAKASSSSSIIVSKVYLDGIAVYHVSSATVNTTIALTAGTHRVTVWAQDAAGLTMKSTVYVTSTSTTATDLTVFNRIEERTSWQTCGNCGNTGASGATASYNLTRGISSPSKDGSSSQFWIGGNYPYKNAYWYIQQTAPTKAVSYLRYEFYLYVPKAYATAPQAIEFECQQKVGGYVYNFAWQANYAGKSWRIFDFINRKWVSSGLGFSGFTPNTWHHVVAEFHTTGAYTVHDALTIDGVRKTVGKKFPAKSATTGRYFTNAFQLDLNGTATDYKVYVDGMTVSLK